MSIWTKIKGVFSNTDLAKSLVKAAITKVEPEVVEYLIKVLATKGLVVDSDFAKSILDGVAVKIEDKI